MAETSRHITAVRFALVPERGAERRYTAVCLCGWTGTPRTESAEAKTDAERHEADGGGS